ncbi:MAG: hypothetical protein GY705_01740, partial [Bacteroidetes bacterium]|nr:hypothetical protein [Bacteroidota bacterium]
MLQDIMFGITIPSKMTPIIPYAFHNHTSALESDHQVSQMIQEGIKAGIYAGPFDFPIPGLVTSPLGAVPKKDSQKVRIIHNLSYPKSASVNSSIPHENCEVKYYTIDDCIKIVAQLGKGALMAKSDYKNAYHSMFISPSSMKFLGFTWHQKYYFGCTLPMGCGISCQRFEAMSLAIHWILTSKFSVPYMSHILDDFMFFGPKNSKICQTSLTKFIQLSDSLGLPINFEKTFQPSTKLELHGILFDTEAMSISIPPDKVLKAIQIIDSLLPCKKVTLRQLQSIAGLLSFFARAIPSARAFIHRLFDLMVGIKLPTHHV